MAEYQVKGSETREKEGRHDILILDVVRQEDQYPIRIQLEMEDISVLPGVKVKEVNDLKNPNDNPEEML